MAKERLVITQGLCDKVKKLVQHGVEQKEIADLLGISKATIGRIKAAGYDLETFKGKNDQRRAADTAKRQEAAQRDEKAQQQKAMMDKYIAGLEEEIRETQRQQNQLQGQISMDLQELEEKKPAEGQKKLYRFLAGQFDETEIAICDKLGKIYDMLGQILRAIRKE